MRRGRGKYGARKTNGFASALESATFDWLKGLQDEGKIKDLKCQHTVVLQGGNKRTLIRWKVDFSFTNLEGQTELVEAKGVETDVYKLKLRLYRNLAPYRLTIVKGTWKHLKVVEVIEAINVENDI